MSEPQTTQTPPRPHLSPKDGFLGLEEISSTWRKTVRSNVMATALTYALAEFSTSNPSSEQSKGAQDFIKVLISLAEPKSQPPGAFPDRRLVPFDENQPPKAEEKKK